MEVYENSKSNTWRYTITVRVSPGVYGNSKSITRVYENSKSITRGI